jgi:bacillithiol biosynthesis deacetylase BshB1
MALDFLAFGPHPDDAEIGLGGTLAKHAAQGFRVGICDLTRGELGSNGTAETRADEAAAARTALGVTVNENLGWPDGAIGSDPHHVRDAVDIIRRLRPRTIAAPYWADRHPDHVNASRVLTEAAFKSGLRRYAAPGEPWRPEWICYYFINDSATPTFVIDVSDCYDIKRKALDCYGSQFARGDEQIVPTRINTPQFRQLIESRDAQFGALAGVAFAEGLIVKDPIVRPHVFRDWNAAPAGQKDRS